MKLLIVLAQSWPDQPFGGSIAVSASLRQYEMCFSRVVYICINETQSDLNLSEHYSKTEFFHIPMKRGGFIKRFLYSLYAGVPAITVGMGGKEVFARIEEVIKGCYGQSEFAWCGVCDDNVPSIHLPKLKREFPGIRWAFRSHDVLHRAFSIFKTQGNWLLRLAWKLETSKIYNFERRSTKSADVNWTITRDDLLLSERVYDCRIDGVFDADVDTEKYANVQAGDSQTLLCLGSADQRKGHGISVFIGEVWPELLDSSNGKSRRLILGGKYTERFSDSKRSIDGRGFVDDELSFLGEGLFFLNPQEAGSGLKLKSLIAMAAGKVLITTQNGALGLGGVPNVHYVVASGRVEMVEEIQNLLHDTSRALKIAKAGRQHVQENFSSEAYTVRIQPLLKSFAAEAQGGVRL